MCPHLPPYMCPTTSLSLKEYCPQFHTVHTCIHTTARTIAYAPAHTKVYLGVSRCICSGACSGVNTSVYSVELGAVLFQ